VKFLVVAEDMSSYHVEITKGQYGYGFIVSESVDGPTFLTRTGDHQWWAYKSYSGAVRGAMVELLPYLNGFRAEMRKARGVA
jgi:hypothetical protein